MMKIQSFSTEVYAFPLKDGRIRQGALIQIRNDEGKSSWGEIAPLSPWSKETFDQSLCQLHQKKKEITQIDWTLDSYSKEIKGLQLFPSVLFGLESALLPLLDPLPMHAVPVSAFLAGSTDEILLEADLRQKEDYTSAKLKVGHLSFKEAERVIFALKDRFRLRIDVNRAWKTKDALSFFSQFPLDAFDYVEEPFQKPKELILFSHPLAVDESFPQDLTLEDLEAIPTLKALIYKPTIQGGMLHCLPLHQWTLQRGIDLVLSSSFESDVGLESIASMAYRLSLGTPVGIGTYYQNKNVVRRAIQFSKAFVIPNVFQN